MSHSFLYEKIYIVQYYPDNNKDIRTNNIVWVCYGEGVCLLFFWRGHGGQLFVCLFVFFS